MVPKMRIRRVSGVTLRDYLFLFHLDLHFLPPSLSGLDFLLLASLMHNVRNGRGWSIFLCFKFSREHSNWPESWPLKGIIIAPSLAATKVGGRREDSPQKGGSVPPGSRGRVVWDKCTEQKGLPAAPAAETSYRVGSAVGSWWGHFLEEWVNSQVLWLNGYCGCFQSLVLLCSGTDVLLK